MLPFAIASIWAYVGITALLVLTPGMSTALVLRNTAEGGRRAGLLTAVGIALGNSAWAVAAVVGLATLLNRQPGALVATRLAGVACLLWLGLRSLRRAWTLWFHSTAEGVVAPPAHTRAPRDGTMVAEGMVTNVLNPSIPAFYLGTVTQFVAPGSGFVSTMALLGSIHVSMALMCHSAYSIAFGRVAVAVSSRGREWVLHGVTGLALIALAAQSVANVLVD
jgi:threonine/homoserine/homoserine lactone efflux protein